MNWLDTLSQDTIDASPAAVREALQEMQKAIRSLELKNEKLAYELAYLKRIRFGRYP